MNQKQEEIKQAQQFGVALGEIKGQLGMMSQMMQKNSDDTNRRIDDFREATQAQNEALNQRIDDHQKASNNRFETLENDVKSTRRKAFIGSGLISTGINALVEALKSMGG